MKVNELKEDRTLDILKDIIVREVQPEKIYLFGSRAKGNGLTDSDYDILIITKDGVDERSMTRKVNRTLYKEKILVETDIIATSISKWNHHKDDIGFIYHQIAREGLVIYG